MRRVVPPLALGVLAASALFLIACGGGGEDKPTAPVIEAPAWVGPESYTYQLSRRGESDLGTCILKTEPGVEPGRTRLSRLCGKDAARDDGTVLVDSRTLAPFASERTRVDPTADSSISFRTTYREGEVYFEANDNGDVNNTTRDLPTPTAEAPSPAWYDDEELLWLARSVPLRQGYQGTYAHVINAGLPRVLVSQVEVQRIEKAEFQGGSADAWRIRLGREDTRYTVWVELAEPHRVLRAQVEDVTYKLIP